MEIKIGDEVECIDKDMWDVFPKGTLFEVVEITINLNVKFIKFKTRKGYFKVGRKTSRKKFVKKCKDMTGWLKSVRNRAKHKTS